MPKLVTVTLRPEPVIEIARRPEPVIDVAWPRIRVTQAREPGARP